jgi:hypothetical protein
MSNCQNPKKETQAEKFKRAVLAVFPTKKEFINFKITEHNKKSKSEMFKQEISKVLLHFQYLHRKEKQNPH